MIRFFTSPENIRETSIELTSEDRLHLRSLRIRPSEEFIVCDGAGTDYVCKLKNGKNENKADFASTAVILRQEKTQSEPTTHCTLYIAYAKGDRLEYAVQKSVELGVTGIILFKSKRCIATFDNTNRKLERLQKIAHEAAKQSGRGIVPIVKNGGEYEEILNTAAIRDGFSILLYEDEKHLHIKQVLEAKPTFSQVAIISGPEGGFELDEIMQAREKGIHIASLGARILRSETAPVVALSVLMFHTDNL
ncbi:MAG: 16S rRNA (uracil(1498)-N(3))-methyltransferase [Oscillospiraceae bacterium]|nr:16S rRNA (uracil(1498)-N(3))-methyltransferase [Oscillospiraceae bacterium]